MENGCVIVRKRSSFDEGKVKKVWRVMNNGGIIQLGGG